MQGIDAYGRRPVPRYLAPALTLNAGGRAPFVLICEHASNRLPPGYGDFGLTPHQRLMHIAWDPGALAVALRMSEQLDAPLVQSTVSRLVVDCNRGPDAVDLIPVISERTEIPANVGISAGERAARIAAFHAPFHAMLATLLDKRQAEGAETMLVMIHSFTPTYLGVERPWPIGLMPGLDERPTRAFEQALRNDDPALNVGWNQPYSSQVGVTYTLELHGDARQLPAVMIELRQDQVLEPPGVEAWSGRLSRALVAAHAALKAAGAV